ncbi:MAG: hypothetical protein JWO30_1846 [Fibrobacteres bacterium]|nr:hypothetical protein [Fibrobacterota bacterium]
MKLINEAGTYYLDENGQRVALTSTDLNLFKQLTPMGRKVRLRQRAVERMAEDKNDLEAQLIISLFQLPAREWSFLVPD